MGEQLLGSSERPAAEIRLKRRKLYESTNITKIERLLKDPNQVERIGLLEAAESEWDVQLQTFPVPSQKKNWTPVLKQ